MAATNAVTPHIVVYSEPSAYVPNSSLQHVCHTLKFLISGCEYREYLNNDFLIILKLFQHLFSLHGI
jgi:hypothetical protein